VMKYLIAIMWLGWIVAGLSGHSFANGNYASGAFGAAIALTTILSAGIYIGKLLWDRVG